MPIVLLLMLGLAEYRYAPKYVFVPNDVKITIPEGMNIADIDQMLTKAGIVPQGTLLTPEYLKLEGVLFPNTYRFDKDSDAEDIVVRMRKEYPDRGILIIASLLEKEVQTETDMRLVAGIIQKRRTAGMALQVDATVAYGACYPKFLAGTYCDVSKINIVDNIKRDSAYNTYTRTGLPQGPIGNPGSKAISAAQNPQTSEYWYYLSTKDGTTIFSRTLEEHNRARARYLR